MRYSGFPCLLMMALIGSACSSSQPKPQTDTLAYAKLANEHYFESDMTKTWNGVDAVFKNFKITSEKADDPTHRTLETDWFETKSNERYQTIMIDKKEYSRPLMSRLKFKLEANSLFTGTKVTIETSEEIETLKDDGTHAGFNRVSSPDPQRAATILDNIQRAILASPAPSP